MCGCLKNCTRSSVMKRLNMTFHESSASSLFLRRCWKLAMFLLPFLNISSRGRNESRIEGFVLQSRNNSELGMKCVGKPDVKLGHRYLQ